MVIYEDNFKETIYDKTYIALGSFDGLHMGHLSLINKTIELAKENNIKSMVFTFKNHPLTVINSDIAPKLIISNDEKTRLLKNLGIDILNYAEFNNKFMKISPEDFICNLIKHYNAKGFVVGFNYRFGYKNLGDVDLLQSLSEKYNFHTYIVKPVKVNGEVISSSKIRHLISEGDITKANYFLTRPFMLEGKVIKGKQLGRKINFPTINLDYDKSIVLPKGGVYFTSIEYKNEKFKSITNIGYNPTVRDKKLSIETHILNFNEDIYNEKVKVFFHKRIRDEKKFESIEKLAEQLSKDKEFAINQSI
ncbi:riboflavin biosynthesis protein RibF [Clostridium homopropionicum DSM 5847]|uniref:Riboflavin biosynthesis protein n=1 Tax=Clostridium homopropionicum DSM 5847 TaxID=1121318 RepID=A0A0L6ZD29_9CLOT|nr:bifunctional riboflavin kinase/FAD synthetase [Clostridium homopropionicum]KOA20880.1 riboflavin biosynthesis protein RibF [Clostridium homopropionicum DSM 5847]SFG03018.1 riboflavin kinase / FMN adenylyltransferase [Clostridium homopropionicum]